MKSLHPFSKLFLALIVINVIAYEQVYSQTKDITQDLAWKRPVAFIENKGQFDNRNWQSSVVEYAVDHNSFRIFFAKDGLTYRFDKFIRSPIQDRQVHEPKRTNVSELVSVTWLNSNPNVEIIVSNKFDAYFSYAIYDRDKDITTNENYIDGYQKLVYKNLYDNIDVEYEIHQGQGIKYNIILHPGADISQIQMKYEAKHTNVENEQISIELDNQDQIVIRSSLGEIKESSPVAFSGANLQEVPVHYHFENNILSFVADEYDKSQIFIIDPWIVSATFNTSGAAWEVETDAAGNVYVIGGETPMRLDKYNSAGALQWSYNTPWDTAGYWLGTLATDLTGTSFITAGTSPRIQRINTSGGMEWNNSGYNASCEYWSITFNCNNPNLMVGGTYVPAISSFDFFSAIYSIDITDGSVISFQTFDSVNISGFMDFPIEARSMTTNKNAKTIFLTHNDVGKIMQNIGTCPSSTPNYLLFKNSNEHNYSYKSENFLPKMQNGGGLKAITSNDLYFYTHSGSQIHRRDLNTGAIINTVNLPGGSSDTAIGKIFLENSGLDVDDCSNVYAGSGDRVVKYDQDLNFISEAMTTSGFTVYDVSVNSNGEVIAVGAVYDNTHNIRQGYIQALDMSACGQYAPVCCDATICPLNPICDTVPAFTLTPGTPGGTWSGTGITNTTTGTFDPSVSGLGTFWIYYTLQCGTDSIPITVIHCVPSDVYNLTNDQIIATIWPNPANTQVNVCYHISNNGKVEAELMDATGRIVLKEQYDSRSGLNHEILNISGLANGIYILNLSSNGTSSKFRIVKN